MDKKYSLTSLLATSSALFALSASSASAYNNLRAPTSPSVEVHLEALAPLKPTAPIMVAPPSTPATGNTTLIWQEGPKGQILPPSSEETPEPKKIERHSPRLEQKKEAPAPKAKPVLEKQAKPSPAKKEKPPVVAPKALEKPVKPEPEKPAAEMPNTAPLLQHAAPTVPPAPVPPPVIPLPLSEPESVAPLQPEPPKPPVVVPNEPPAVSTPAESNPFTPTPPAPKEPELLGQKSDIPAPPKPPAPPMPPIPPVGEKPPVPPAEDKGVFSGIKNMIGKEETPSAPVPIPPEPKAETHEAPPAPPKPVSQPPIPPLNSSPLPVDDGLPPREPPLPLPEPKLPEPKVLEPKQDELPVPAKPAALPPLPIPPVAPQDNPFDQGAPLAAGTNAIVPPPPKAPPPPPAPSKEEAKKPEQKPVEKSATEKSTNTSDQKPDLRLTFSSTETSVPLSMRPELDNLSAQLKGNEDTRVTIAAYASGSPDQPSTARRVSLSRALAVRAYLIDKGVSNLRINVQAEGSKGQGAEADRVDVFIKTPDKKG